MSALDKERVEKLDRIFDMLIVLAGIVTASLFQYIASASYSQEQAGQYEWILRMSFKLFLIPIALTIIIWIPVQLARNETIRALLSRIFAWAYLLQMLSIYLMWTMAFGFGHILSFWHLAAAALVTAVIFGGLLLRFVAADYQRAMKPEVFKTKRNLLLWSVITIMAAATLAEASIYLSVL